MRKHLIYFAALAIALISVTACNDDDGEMMESSLALNITGLEDLGADYLYEGWLIVDGNPVTTGTFSVDASGNMSQNEFPVAMSDLETATSFVLTIEPSPDSDPAPSDVHILAGDFDNGSASLSIDHAAALDTDFANVSGKYILATPTNGMSTNENSGIWWLDNMSGSPLPALVLPDLPAGWIYEGWVVIDGQPVTTGTFDDGTMADDDAPYSSTMSPAPPFPGEDFLLNAPAGLSFPTDLSEGTAVISVEPVPDNSAAPFLLKPLVGMIPTNAQDHTLYIMDQNLAFPTGEANR